MRHNGLPGNDFVAVADVEPQVADALLELLRDADVPAYADAATPHRGVYNEVRLPDRPTDRIFVQRDRRDIAHALLQERLPGLRADYEASSLDTPRETTTAASTGTAAVTDITSDRTATANHRGSSDVDEDAWASIVAAYGAPSFDGRPPVTGDSGEPTDEGSVLDAQDARIVRGPLVSGPRDYIAVAADDHFEPPTPPPLGRLDPVGTLAWLGVLGAPVFFAIALWVGVDVEGWLGLAGVGAFLGGFAVLFSRLGPDREDDGDDGAVI